MWCVMTNIKKSDDERRTHRMITYLTDNEILQIKQKYEQSGFDNFSQYHRDVLLKSITDVPHLQSIPPASEEFAKSLTNAVHSISRFIAQLEMYQLIFQQSNNSDIQAKIADVLSEVRRIGSLCYTVVGWYRQNHRDEKSIIKSIASLTLTSDELQVLVDTVRTAESEL